MGLQLLVLLLVISVLYVPFCKAHAYVILDRLSRTPSKLTDEDYHKIWHQSFTHFRVALHIIIGVTLYYWSGNVWLALKLTFVGAAYATLIFDSLIDYFRGQPIWDFSGTCDGDWDFDCFYLWLKRLGINHILFKATILIITIILSVVL